MSDVYYCGLKLEPKTFGDYGEAIQYDPVTNQLILPAYRVGLQASTETKMRVPSKERGCDGKANLGRSYKKQADRLAMKHGKTYAVYRCPHCGGTHLTTKLHKAGEYADLLYVTQTPS